MHRDLLSDPRLADARDLFAAACLASRRWNATFAEALKTYGDHGRSMMTPERARDVIRSQSQFPYWGNYSRFMTTDELDQVMEVFRAAPSGNISVAAIVHRVARGADPSTGEIAT